MWIDILSTSGGKNEYGKWDFSSITIELFPRKIKPVYPEYSSIADKKYITWKTANEDISKQRKKGYKGKRFVICPKLVNKNQGKTKIVEKIWNKKFINMSQNIGQDPLIARYIRRKYKLSQSGNII